MRILLNPALTLVAMLVLFVTACGGSDDGNETTAAGGAAKTFEIVETEFQLEPSTVTLEAPGTYTFRAVNEGETEHALELEGEGLEEETENIAPGESAELTVEITDPGEYELYCPVGDHKDRGMEGTVELRG